MTFIERAGMSQVSSPIPSASVSKRNAVRFMRFVSCCGRVYGGPARKVSVETRHIGFKMMPCRRRGGEYMRLEVEMRLIVERSGVDDLQPRQFVEISEERRPAGS